MDYYARQQVAGEEMWGGAAGERRNTVVLCPTPRRLGELAGAAAEAGRPQLRWQAAESKAGADLLEIFLAKGGEVASSPPFFNGSPPSRAANPVVHDARFGQEKPLLPSGSSPMSPRQGCGRAKYGLKPAAVRIEGFDCRRDRRSITAVA